MLCNLSHRVARINVHSRSLELQYHSQGDANRAVSLDHRANAPFAPFKLSGMVPGFDTAIGYHRKSTRIVVQSRERDKFIQEIRWLPGFGRSEGLQNMLKVCWVRLLSYVVRKERAKPQQRETLALTYEKGVVKSVLDAVVFSTITHLLVSDWLFAFLPIHAAGLYRLGYKVSDFVVFVRPDSQYSQTVT
ncbi:hypothetical protein OG21DRAFT_1538061 [Imleria badia]|nr:hypothetical protein OG21DRAFT_1538061 [Imleria badia]